MTYEEVQQKLKDTPKTMEGLRSFVSEMLTRIAFDFHQRYGFPVELFQEELNSKDMNGLEQVELILNYYKNK